MREGASEVGTIYDLAIVPDIPGGKTVESANGSRKDKRPQETRLNGKCGFFMLGS